MDFKELERSISDKQTADIVKLLLLKTYQPDSLTVQEKEDHKHLWKDAVERHFRKTGVAASEDTLDSIWATVRSDLLSAKEPQVHDTFKFQLRAMSQKELDDDEKELPNLALHRCITNVSGIRSVLISREWIDLPSNEERARQKNKKYVEVSSDTPAINRRIACPELASSVSEVQTNIVFFDMEKTTVDWPSTIRNLQEYAQSHYYDHLMVKIALINILKYSSRFSDIEYFLDKDADQIARHLLRSSANDDKFTYHRTKLFNLTRRVNQPLTEILEVADQYISVLFKGEGNKKQRENYSLLALLSFVSDDLSTHISDQIKLKKSMGENINLQYYRNLCLKMEAQKGNMPPVPLKFNRKVDFLPAVSMTMNCHQDEDSPYKRMLRYNDGLRNFNHQIQGDGMYCFVPAGMSYEVYYRHNNAHYKIPISDIAVDDVKSAILSEKAPVNQILPSIIQNFPTAVSKQDFDIKFMDANNTLNPQDRQRYVQSTNPVGTVQMIQTPPAAGINNQNLYPSLPGIMQPSCPPMPQAILPYYHSDKDPKSPEYYTDTSSVKSFEYKQADAFNVPVKGQRSGGLPRTPVKHVDNRSVKSPARIIQGLKDAMKQTVSEPVRTRSNEDLTNQSMRNIVDVIDSQQG